MLGATSSPLRVLIVDDYPDSAESAAQWLALEGFETRIARDGEEALAVANQWHPHVCIVDLAMPRIDGFEFAAQMRGQPWAAGILLIAHSGLTSGDVKKRAQQAGFKHYLTKPSDPKELTRIIKAHGS